MNETATPPPTPATAIQLTERTARYAETMQNELAEIELLVQQARTEAGRHESKRAAVAERLVAARAAGAGDPVVQLDLAEQLVTLTKRAVLMDAQVEVLEGKAKVLGRHRDMVAELAASLTALTTGPSIELGRASGERVAVSPAFSRIVLGAQEDLRRDIARAMHDGPAQSLTNIVLQAQIVERLMTGEPERAQEGLQQLVSMVQTTLDATKTFIFEVRPMVLDDLGLVPTLRRAARERGQRASIPVELESLGLDRRLSMEIESGLFRMVDEALAGFLSNSPERVSIRLDWGDQLDVRVRAERTPALVPEAAADPVPAPSRRRGKGKEQDLPPALAAMIEDRRADRAAAVDAAHRAAMVALPAASWREIQDRASTLGMKAELVTWDEQLEPSPEVRPDAPAASPAAPPSASLTDQAPQPLTELRLVAEIADLPGAG
jgi:two-component system, NarL family, sensor histidine kinase DegS